MIKTGMTSFGRFSDRLDPQDRLELGVYPKSLGDDDTPEVLVVAREQDKQTTVVLSFAAARALGQWILDNVPSGAAGAGAGAGAEAGHE